MCVYFALVYAACRRGASVSVCIELDFMSCVYALTCGIAIPTTRDDEIGICVVACKHMREYVCVCVHQVFPI